MGRSSRLVRTVGIAMVVLATGVACSQQAPAPPARQYTVTYSVTGTAGGAAFGRYVTLGELGSTSQTNFTGLPFELTMTVPYPPAPKLQAGVVGVRPGSSLSCRITVDGAVVAARTVPAPGQDVLCGVG